jgi:hypothetical protein
MSDEWTVGGAVLDDAALARLKKILDEESPVIVEHRFYRGSSEPHRLVVSDHDELVTYLRTRGQPGDSFWFWAFDRCCTDGNSAAHGKLPDAEGRVPIGGAY